MRAVDCILGMAWVVLALLVTFNMYSRSMQDDSIRELVKLEVSQQIKDQHIPTTINAKYVTVINGEELLIDDGKEDK